VNRLSGRGKSEENEGRQQAKRRGGGGDKKEGEREGPRRPFPQSMFGSLRSLISFRAFFPLWNLFTGYTFPRLTLTYTCLLQVMIDYNVCVCCDWSEYLLKMGSDNTEFTNKRSYFILSESN